MTRQYSGVFPALPVPFASDMRVDRAGLERLADWLVGHDGISGLVTNGIAGEVFALHPDERAEVTRAVATAAAGRVPVISGLYCERLDEAGQQALEAKQAGATAILVMPPGRWLRYGMHENHVLAYFEHIARASGLPLVVHMYPASTKAAYAESTLQRLAGMPEVVAFKVGTREMADYEANLRAIREARDDVALLTCQDEFLLASMVQGIDGAMVGFASFVPELVTELWDAVSSDDLSRARDAYNRAYPLNQIVYGDGHPNYENYPRMKAAMEMCGRLASGRVRPPIESPDAATRAEIEAELRKAGLLEDG